ncbi:carbon-nitrogen hydrolase family protein [Haloglomus litoreum]|uniref:carbon-nitrogen hydrolase family protein n=1 Tax=Haloglomus litoreum TaxID=3034026 RepID=UPI0023E838D9|nr:carbon-nitrogen hydrolase family protein [Haloglomus sp. DT116]
MSTDTDPEDRPTVAACQTAVTDLDPAANLATLRERVAALPDGVDAALFPEQFLTGFVPDDRMAEAAVRTDGSELDAVRECAAEHDVAVLVGYVGVADGDLHNTVAYVRPDGGTTTYRKRHLWAGERKVLTPGEERVTVETPLGTTGLATCYDLNFVADSAAYTEERIDALFVVGAWPAAHSENWRLLVRARALDGVRWAVAAGRTGRREVADAPTATYGGRSMVARPNGSVRASLADAERDLVVSVDPDEMAYHRKRVGIYRD